MIILIETFHSPYTGERVGGAETSLKLIAEGLAKKNHQVLFFSKSYTKTWCGFKMLSVNQVKVIVFTKFKLNILNNYRFKKLSIYFRNIYIKSKIKNVDIVHTYNNIGIVKYYANIKSNYNFKLVVRMAGLKLFEDFENRPHLIPVYEKHFKKIDLFNFISDGLRELVEEKSKQFNLRLNFQPFFVEDIGVDFASLPIKSFNIQNDNKPFKIVMASRFTKFQKRQDLLIDAISLLTNNNIKLFFYGDGPTKKILMDKVEQSKLSHKIIFKPFISQKLLWQEIMNNDLLVHACDYEGLSKIIIESLAVGQPVLCSKVLPMKNYIVEGYNGFLVDNTPSDWANKLLYLSENQEKLKMVSENSILYAKKNYDKITNINNYDFQFKKLIN